MTAIPFVHALALYLAAHLVLDFPLQGDTTAREKNPNSTSDLQRHVPWPYWMAAHSAAHALGVFAVTAYLSRSASAPWSLAAAEFVWHFAIDLTKCRNPRFTIHHDQAAHSALKVVFTLHVIGVL